MTEARNQTLPAATTPDAPPHVPVLLAEVLEAIGPRDGETYVDGTFGAGGYSRALLDAADCRVIAIDRDPEAVAGGRAMEREFGGRLRLVEGRFSELDRLIEGQGTASVDGIALDVGVSSMQLDQAERGFSFQKDGPLDMRMSGAGADGDSAADVVNELPEKDLADIIRGLGEEPKARRIARAIVAAREEEPITRTGQLAGIIADAVGYRKFSRNTKSGRTVHPATKTFQALRIYVNDELGELSRGLEAAERALAPEGRLAVVSFHSLEDRIVKRFFAERSGRVPSASRHRPPEPAGAPATFRLPGKSAVRPGDDELDRNPRARSAKLRCAVRTEAPAWGRDDGGAERAAS